MTWIWPYSQNYCAVKEQLRRDACTAQRSNDKCIAGTGAGRIVRYPHLRMLGSCGVGHDDTKKLVGEIGDEKRKRTQGPRSKNKSLALGGKPRVQRNVLRPSGVSAKRSVRTLHQVGSWYMIPRIDYLNYRYAGIPKAVIRVRREKQVLHVKAPKERRFQ